MSLGISDFHLEIENGTENAARYFGFSSRNRKRDRKCRSAFRIFVSKSKTGQKVSLGISDFRLEIKNETESVACHFGFSSRNRKRDRKCSSPFRIFVSKSKTRQKMLLGISDFRLEIKNGTENVARHFGFSSRNQKRDRKCRSAFRIFASKSKTGQKMSLRHFEFEVVH